MVKSLHLIRKTKTLDSEKENTCTINSRQLLRQLYKEMDKIRKDKLKLKTEKLFKKNLKLVKHIKVPAMNPKATMVSYQARQALI